MANVKMEDFVKNSGLLTTDRMWIKRDDNCTKLMEEPVFFETYSGLVNMDTEAFPTNKPDGSPNTLTESLRAIKGEVEKNLKYLGYLYGDLYGEYEDYDPDPKVDWAGKSELIPWIKKELVKTDERLKTIENWKGAFGPAYFHYDEAQQALILSFDAAL